MNFTDGMPRCLAPWTTKYYGVHNWSLCTCMNNQGEPEMNFNSEQYTTIRKALLAGNVRELPEACQLCYDSPTSMADFYRQDFHKEHYQRYIGLYNPETGEMNEQRIAQFLVNMGNKCNQACRMCDPQNSDVLAADLKVMGLFNGQVRQKATGDYLREFKEQLPHLREISFHGGEPLLNREATELLKLALPYKDQLNILFMTNGKTDTFHDGTTLSYWAQQFPNFSVPYSIDGIPKVNEYIRQGSDTAQTYKNMRKLRKEAPHTTITIRHTTSNMNIEWLPEFLSTVDEHSNGAQNWLTTDKVIIPSIYAPDNLPDGDKRRVVAKLQEYRATETDEHKRWLAMANIRYLFAKPFDAELWAEHNHEKELKDRYYGKTL